MRAAFDRLRAAWAALRGRTISECDILVEGSDGVLKFTVVSAPGRNGAVTIRVPCTVTTPEWTATL